MSRVLSAHRSQRGNSVMLNPELWAEQLYDGTGAHHAGVWPPLMIENKLTDTFAMEKAMRPHHSVFAVDDYGQNLGWVWMMPLGLKAGLPCPNFGYVLGALVQAVDAGQGVIVHADDPEMAAFAIDLVCRFSGGGHA